MKQAEMEKLVDFMVEVRQFQTTYRATTKSDTTYESDAEHSWSVAFNVMLMLPELQKEFTKLDEKKMLMMAIVHDLAEIKTGDTKTWDAVARKNKDAKERVAMEELLSQLPKKSATLIRTVWDECEARETPEAKIVKSLDRIDPALQRLTGNSWGINEKEHATLQAFDERQIERHKFSDTLMELYQVVRAKVISKFKLP